MGRVLLENIGITWAHDIAVMIRAWFYYNMEWYGRQHDDCIIIIEQAVGASTTGQNNDT